MTCLFWLLAHTVQNLSLNSLEFSLSPFLAVSGAAVVGAAASASPLATSMVVD